MSESPAGKFPVKQPKGRLLYGLEIALIRLRFVGVLVVVMVLAAYWDDIVARVERWLHREAAPAVAADGVEFFCPMHPQIVRPQASKCPTCGMPLSQRRQSTVADHPAGVLARVQFSPLRIAQGGIRTSPVEYRPLEREIQTAGFIDYDERKLTRISTRFHGRVESTRILFRGITVARADSLVTLYSPEVFAAEETLLSALRGLREAEAAEIPDARAVERGNALADSARSRLVLWGLWPEQIDAIEKLGEASPLVEVLAPLSGVVTKKVVLVGDYVTEGAALCELADLSTVWIVARVFEEDLGVIKVGQPISSTASAFPGEIFAGTIVFVDPFLDRATRTADLRADLPNPDGRLRPGMYVNAVVRVDMSEVEPFRSMPRPAMTLGPRVEYACPMHPEIVHDAPGNCEECGGMALVRREIPATSANGVLAIPETAVIDTGKRRVVYVESSPGVFDAREVVLGPRVGAFYPVVEGLDAGMRVATAGSFLIDAETRLDPAAAGSYFGASAAPEPGSAAGHENDR